MQVPITHSAPASESKLLEDTNIKLADPNIYDADRRDDMKDLVRNQSELSGELEVAEKEWLEKITELEAIK